MIKYMLVKVYIVKIEYIIVRGELLLYTPVVVRSNRIPPPCVFATQDSTRKDSTQTFNIKSCDQKFTHSEQIGPKTHTVMGNQTNATAQQAIAEQNAAQVASTNENQAQTLAEGTVKKFTVQVKRVQLFEKEDIVNVQLTLNKAIPGFVKNDDDEYVPADTDHISLSRSSLTRALCEHDEFIATMRDGQETPLTRAQLSTILHGAILAITRTYHVTGYAEKGRDALKRDQWFTDIESVKLTDLANKLIQQLVMQRMMNE